MKEKVLRLHCRSQFSKGLLETPILYKNILAKLKFITIFIIIFISMLLTFVLAQFYIHIQFLYIGFMFLNVFISVLFIRIICYEIILGIFGIYSKLNLNFQENAFNVVFEFLQFYHIFSAIVILNFL